MDCPQHAGLECSPPLPAPETGISPVAEHETTAQHLASLIFLSYRFSQGGIGTQNRMLLYIEENFHPDLMVGEQADEVKSLTHQTVGRYFLNQKLHPATAIPWEDDSPEAAVKTEVLVTNELAGLFERFTDREPIRSFTSDAAGIAQSVIVMDLDYLRRPGGRAGDSEDLKIVVSPYTRDPYDSLFIKHSVLGKGTNTAEYDAIFHMLATEPVLRQLDRYTLRQLQSVIDIYAAQHPDVAQDERIAHIKTLSMELLHARQS
jgi:hypothetical protein